jgi:colicin import membrane protein
MQRRGPSFISGLICSLVGHVLGALFVLVFFESASSNAAKTYEVFTVTLEGGDRLGGKSITPEDLTPNKKPLPIDVEKAAPPPEKVETEKKETVQETKKVETTKEEVKPPEKKLTEPAVVPDVEKALKEQREKEIKEMEQKIAEEKAEEKKVQDKKLKEQQEKEKKEQDERKKIEDKKLKAEEKKKRDELILKRTQQLLNKFKGESAPGGGVGIGAPRIEPGKNGGGGGTPESLEFVAYLNMLQDHIKAQWNWMKSQTRFRAEVQFQMLPDGTILQPRIVSSSGNSNFDDSVLRALFKASPAPRPPDSIYPRFKTVTTSFDSQDR